MLRILTFLTALFFAGAAAASTAYVDAPKDGYLNLRTGPSTGYRVIEQMPHRSRVEVIRRPGRWVKLRSSTGRVGWAHGSWLSEHRPGKPNTGHHGGNPHGPSQGTWYVDAPNYNGLNLRTGPGTGYKVARLMRNGDRVELLGRKGSWWLLRHQSGAVGYAHSGYLSKQKPRRGYGQGNGYGNNHGGNYGNHDWNRNDNGTAWGRILLRCSGREGIALRRCVAWQLAQQQNGGYRHR